MKCSSAIRSLSASLLLLGGFSVYAAPRTPAVQLSCTATITDTVNGAAVFNYNPSFVLQPGVDFREDLSSALRFGDFLATASRTNDKTTLVTITYFRDRGVFETGEFAAQLHVPDNRTPLTVSGRSTSDVISGTTTRYQTDHSLTCQRLN